MPEGEGRGIATDSAVAGTKPKGHGLVRQSAFTLASRILILFINIPISIIVARKLGVDGQGVYAAAGAFATLWGTCWILGIDAAHTYFLASGRASLGRILANTFLWLAGLSALAVPSYLVLGHLIDAEKMRTLLPVLGITAAIVPLVIARYLYLGVFLGLREIDRYNLLNVLSQFLLLVALVAVLLVGRGGTKAAVAAFGGSILVLVILASILAERRRRKDDPLRVDGELAKRTLSYGIRGYGTTLFGQLNYRFDQVLVPFMVGTTQLGYYSIAVLMAEKLAHITNSIQLVLFPKVSSSTAEEANRITTTACRHALFWMALSAVVLWAVAPLLIRTFYGHEFLPALGPLRFLIPGIFLLTFWKILTVDLSGRNQRFVSTIASCGAFVVNTVLNFLWIPKHGMLGAAWASAISYGMQSLLIAIFFLRITGVPARRLVVPEPIDLEIYRRLFQRVRARTRAGR